MSCTKDTDCPLVNLTNTIVNGTCVNVNVKSYPAAPSAVELSYLGLFNISGDIFGEVKSGFSTSTCMSRQICQALYDESYLRKSEGVYDDG